MSASTTRTAAPAFFAATSALTILMSLSSSPSRSTDFVALWSPALAEDDRVVELVVIHPQLRQPGGRRMAGAVLVDAIREGARLRDPFGALLLAREQRVVETADASDLVHTMSKRSVSVFSNET